MNPSLPAAATRLSRRAVIRSAITVGAVLPLGGMVLLLQRPGSRRCS